MSIGKPIPLKNLGNLYVLPGDFVALLCHQDTLKRFTTDELKKMQFEISTELKAIETKTNHQLGG